MLSLETTKRFEKDLKRMEKRGYHMAAFREVLTKLLTQEPLETRHREHSLKGMWSGYFDCHIKPDWILIYKRTETTLLLERTGTHSDLF